MDRISTDDLRSLLADRGGLRVSLYMPTERGGREAHRNTTCFENLLRRAKLQLAERGADPDDVEAVLETGRKAIGDHELWQHPQDGLAAFLSADSARFHRAPERFPERVVTGERFYAKPLFPVVDRGDHFYALALSRNSARFFRADRREIEELAPERMPHSFDAALRLDEPTIEVQSHTLGGRGGRPSIVYHGHSPGDLRNSELFLYCRRVDQALRPLLIAERPLLVLAAVEELWPVYRQANTCAELVLGLRGSPDLLSAQEILARANELLATREDGAAHALAAYDRLPHPERASDRVEPIVRAAAQGRVDRLLVAADRAIWGHFDAESQEVALHERELPASDDLGDVAAAETWLHGGEVFVIPVDRMPLRAPLAATFRY